jgi:hypothetical protein
MHIISDLKSGVLLTNLNYVSVYRGLIFLAVFIFFKDRVVVQSFKISTLFTVYISLLISGTSFTIS